HSANAIIGAYQRHFLVPGQVAEVEETEFSIGNETAAGTRVLGLVFVLGFGGLTVGIGLAGFGQRFGEHVAVRCEDFDGETLNGYVVTGLDEEVIALVANCRVGVKQLVSRFLAGLEIRAVIDKVFDRQFGRQLRHSADMIGMVVGDEQVVNLFDAGFGRGGSDAIGVAVIDPGPAG